MLAAKPHSIASAQARVGDHVKPDSLPRAYGPARLIGPICSSVHGMKPLVTCGADCYAGGRIGLDQTGLVGPPEQTAHGIQEVSRLVWRLARRSLPARIVAWVICA